MLASIKRSILTKILIILFVVLNILGIKSFAIVNPTSDFYVNDYANLLSAETKNYIMNTNIDLHSKTGAQIVVVTVPSLDGNSLEDYATQLFRNFGIGDKQKNNGVLLLLALKERLFRVEVGYGLEGALPDGKTGRIQDEYIIPYLKNDNWNEGIRNGFSAILQVVEEEYNVDVGGESASRVYHKENDSDDVLPAIGVGMVFVSGAVGSILRFLKQRKKIIYSIVYLILSNVLIYILFSFRNRN